MANLHPGTTKNNENAMPVEQEDRIAHLPASSDGKQKSLKLLIQKSSRRLSKLIYWILTLQLNRKIKSYGGIRVVASSLLKKNYAPPRNDYLLKVPFNYDILPWEPSVAVICHMFYMELLDEIAQYLEHIPFPVDMYFVTDTLEKKVLIEQKFTSWKQGTFEVRLAPNKGRDIAPKIISCRDVHEDHEFVLYLHTKLSKHIKLLEQWRLYLFDTLLGSEVIVRSIFEAFRLDPNLGMIAPQHYNLLATKPKWAGSKEQAKKFAKDRLKIPFPRKLDFPSGAMFWARSSALKTLLDANIQLSDFPDETGQLDYTFAHVMERFFFIACEHAGFKWIKIAEKSTKEAELQSREVSSQDEVAKTISDLQRHLVTKSARTNSKATEQ